MEIVCFMQGERKHLEILSFMQGNECTWRYCFMQGREGGGGGGGGG